MMRKLRFLLWCYFKRPFWQKFRKHGGAVFRVIGRGLFALWRSLVVSIAKVLAIIVGLLWLIFLFVPSTAFVNCELEKNDYFRANISFFL